jgi:transcriptional regulatory protein LevR
MVSAVSKDGQKHPNEAGHMLKSGRQGCVDKETEQKKKKLLKDTPGNYHTFHLVITCKSGKGSANKLCFFVNLMHSSKYSDVQWDPLGRQR